MKHRYPGPADVTAVTVWLRTAWHVGVHSALTPPFCPAVRGDEGLVLGCHRGEGHPEGVQGSWHLDRARGRWWKVTGAGEVVQIVAEIPEEWRC